MRELEQNRSLVCSNISQNLLLQERPGDADLIHELVELIAETLSIKRKTIRIAGNLFSAAVVRSRLMKLDAEHIRFVLDCMKENTTRIKNIRSYLLTALFHAPITINSYFSARVNHDLTIGDFSDCLLEPRSEKIASCTHLGAVESVTLDLTHMTSPISPVLTYRQQRMA